MSSDQEVEMVIAMLPADNPDAPARRLQLTRGQLNRLIFYGQLAEADRGDFDAVTRALQGWIKFTLQETIPRRFGPGTRQ
jgi:hypothetical protein